METVSTQVLQIIAHAGEALGADVEAVLGRVGLTRATLTQREARVTVAEEDALWEAMADALEDRYFGLRSTNYPHFSRPVYMPGLWSPRRVRGALPGRRSPGSGDVPMCL